jgi:hypothetical protein
MNAPLLLQIKYLEYLNIFTTRPITAHPPAQLPPPLRSAHCITNKNESKSNASVCNSSVTNISPLRNMRMLQSPCITQSGSELAIQPTKTQQLHAQKFLER